MRKLTVAFILCSMALGTPYGVYLVNGVTIYKPEQIPFDYDVNQVNYELLGGAQMTVGDNFVCDVNYVDEQDEPIVAKILNSPVGFDVIGQDKEWQMTWTPEPNQIGIHYIDLEIEDVPEYGTPGKDTGSIVIKVHKQNTAPILRPICGG